MSDLSRMTAVEAVAWLSAARIDPHDAYVLVSRGVTDTALIETTLATRPDAIEALTDLAPKNQIANEELDDFLLIGAAAWVGDPENRAAWLGVARAAAVHETRIGAKYSRKDPNGMHRAHLHPRQAVTAVYEAGRGPGYAREVIKRATEFNIEIDAYGFGDDITPGFYTDLASAGIGRSADLNAYLAAGLTPSEAVVFSGERIAPAAVLMARVEGHPKSAWRGLLAGIPQAWFRPLGDHHYTHAGAMESYETGLTHYLRVGGSDRYRLADLRYLVDHGWTDKDDLKPRGLADLVTYRDSDMPAGHARNRYAAAEVARQLADHAMTWQSLERWAEALTVGKKPEYKTDTNRAPLFGYGKGRGLPAIPLFVLGGDFDFDPGPYNDTVAAQVVGGVFALVDAGLKPSHMSAYRKAGCHTIADVLSARAHGITAKEAERLCKTYGHQPEPRWHKNTWVINGLGSLMLTWRKDQDSRSDRAEAVS